MDPMGNVDGSEIRRENHLGCKKNRKWWDNLPTSTGDLRISQPDHSVVRIGFFDHQYYLESGKGLTS